MTSDKCIYQECDGTGYIFMVNESGETIGIECKCKKDREYMIELELAKIPSDFLLATVSSFNCEIYGNPKDKGKAEFAKDFAYLYVENFIADFKDKGKGIYLYSATKGSGKTRLAISILNALIKKYKVAAMYISSVNMLNEIKHTFRDDTTLNSYDVIKRISDVDVLLIDDLGVEKATGWSEEIITQVLENRMNFKKVTLFTSNMRISELDSKYKNGRVSSRIEKMTFEITMPEESIRSKNAELENREILNKYFKR